MGSQALLMPWPIGALALLEPWLYRSPGQYYNPGLITIALALSEPWPHCTSGLKVVPVLMQLQSNWSPGLIGVLALLEPWPYWSPGLIHGLLNRWTSQYDWGITTG